MSEDGEVITLTEPQVWTLIGVFSASLFAMFGTVSGLFVRVVRSEIRAGVSALHGELRGDIGRLDGRVDALDGRIQGLRSEMNARFERVDTKLDHLDRDVQALTRQVFPERE